MAVAAVALEAVGTGTAVCGGDETLDVLDVLLVHFLHGTGAGEFCARIRSTHAALRRASAGHSEERLPLLGVELVLGHGSVFVLMCNVLVILIFWEAKQFMRV